LSAPAPPADVVREGYKSGWSPLETPGVAARGVSLRSHLSSSGAVLIAIALAIVGIYLPVVIVPYAFSDDYPILAIADGLGPNPWFGHSLISDIAANGRPFAGLLDQLVFPSAGTIDNLRFVRLLGVLGIVALALLLHWALVRSRIRPVPAGLIAVLVCTTAAFQVYGSWAVLFNAPYAALLAGAASMLAVEAIDAPRPLVLDRLLAAGALLLAALLIYQPAAMFFWVFLAVALVGSLHDTPRTLRLARAHLAMGSTTVVLAFLISKLASHLAGKEAPNSRLIAVTHDPIGKIGWLLHQPLYWSLNLFVLTPRPWLAALVGTVAIGGSLLGLRHLQVRLLPYVGLALLLIPLTFLPNLVAAKKTPSYRVVVSLSSLMALYISLGALGLWLVGRRWLRHRVSTRALVAVQGVALACAFAFVGIAAYVAARNVTTLVVEPQNTELRMLRRQVAALPLGVQRAGFVEIGWNQGLVSRYISDEFIPSSSQPWTGSSAVLLILREQGRLGPGAARPIIDTLSQDTSVFPSEPLVDMRGLQQLR
jgi:hypothetical protein